MIIACPRRARPRSIVPGSALAALVWLIVGSAPVLAADVYRVGAPLSLSGGFAEPSQIVLRGFEMAVDDINRAGGIKALGGARLQVVAADTTGGDPAQAASVTRRLVTVDHVVALMGAHASSMTLSVQTEAERLKVPLITTSYADLIVQRGYAYTFKLPPLASEFSRAGIDYMKEIAQAAGKPLKKVAMFYGSDAAGKATGTAFLPLLEKSGLEIVAKGTFQSGMTDVTPIMTQIKSSQPDIVYIYGYVSDLILTIRGLRSIGMNIPVVSSGGPVTTKAIVESLGKTANGLFGTVMWNGDLNYPGVKEFTKAYLTKYPDERFVIAEAGEGYVSGWLIKEAMERARSAEPTKIRDALAKMEVSQGPAAMMPPGKVAFAANGLSKFTFPIMIEWINEEPRTVWPANVQTVKPLF